MRFAAIAFLLALVSACTDKRTALVPAPPPPTQLAITPARELRKEDGQSEEVVGISVWQIQIAEFRSSAIEQLGLKLLFDQPFRTNAGTAEAMTNSATFQLAKAETNVNLNIRVGAHTGICSDQNASNLVQKFMATAGVDLLTFSSLFLRGTNEGLVAAQNQYTLVTSGGRPAVTITVGAQFDFRVLGMKGSTTVVQIAGRFEQFQGYSVTNQGPVLDLQVWAATVELKPDEAFLFGSKEEQKVQITEERVPYVSDIRTFGRLFIKRHTETNYVRHIGIVRRRSP